MKIKRIKVDNYRNLSETEILLDSDSNFIVGENDLGKSNFIDMLDIIFNNSYRGFSAYDFKEEDDPIKIEFTLLLTDVEKGAFEDYFDPTGNCDRINVIAEQKEPHERIIFFHKETNEEIPYKKFRCVNFLKYDSLRKPKDELRFYKGKGASKFLAFMVNKYLNEEDINEEDIIDKDSVRSIIEYINVNINKIDAFKEFMLNVYMEDELPELIHSILTLRNAEGFKIDKIGYGAQFSVLILLDILDKLMKLVEGKWQKDCIFEIDGKRYVSLILGLDEPEIHLHPYMQRNLIKYVNKVVCSSEPEFCELTKELFDIDHINGQCIVVTHSPNILHGSYKNVIRFYENGGQMNVKSGSEIDMPEQLEKHLKNNSPYIKEAFFSRCNILVEGDCEYGAFPVFAERLGNIDLDSLGISIIKAGSANSIPPLAKLMNLFGIQNVGIIDNPEFETFTRKGLIEADMNIFPTNGRHFEEEIYDAFKIEDYIKYIEENEVGFIKNELIGALVEEADNLGLEIDADNEVYSQLKDEEPAIKTGLKTNFKEIAMAKLGRKKNKSYFMGRTIANYVSNIPQSYEELITEAARLSNND